MPKRTLDLQFPLGGLDRRLAHQKQRPFTTRLASNVRAEGTLEKLLRGGSRPGIVKTFSTRIGSGSPIRMMATMRSLASEGRLTFEEDFDSLSEWTAMDTSWAEDGGLPLLGGNAHVPSGHDVGSILNDGELANIEDSSSIINASYSAEVFISPITDLATAGFTDFYVYARLDDTTPVQSSNVYCRIRITFVDANRHVGIFLGTDDDHATETQFGDIWIPPSSFFGNGWLTLTIEPLIATGKWTPIAGGQPQQSVSGALAITAPVANTSRVALRVNNDEPGQLGQTVTARIGPFNVRYFSAAGGLPPESKVAASKHGGADATAADQGQGSNVWYETNQGEMTEVPSKRDGSASGEETDLNHDVTLMAVDRLGKLYIADHGERQSGTDGTFSADGLTFDDVANTDWSEATGIGVDEEGDWLEVLSTGDEALATLGVYKITGATGAGVVISSAGSTGAVTGGVKYRIVRGPKIFDPAADAGSKLVRWEPNPGSIPLNCSIIELFSNRIVLAGDPENAHVWRMTRWGNPLDFDYFASATDRGKAATNFGDTPDSSGLSLPLSAVAALTEDYCLFSSESDLWLQRGDPNVGGIMGNMSRQIGIGSRTAWCRIPDGSIAFLTRDGLYRFHPSQPFPQSVSREKLPAELIDVVQNTDLVVTLEYDVRFRGVHIYIVPKTAGATEHYWFHWEAQGFWSTSFGSTDYEPFNITYDAKTNHVLLGCRDGYIRHYDVGAADDDGTAFATEIDYGPIPLNRGRAAIADSLKFTLDDNSGDVSWTFRSGHSPEEAFTAIPRASGTAKAGVNYVQSIRHFGEWGYLRLSTTGAVRWAVEAIELYVLTTPARARKI